MGKMLSGILGGVSGSVGSVTGAVVAGVPTIRKRQAPGTGGHSPAQEAVRLAFKQKAASIVANQAMFDRYFPLTPKKGQTEWNQRMAGPATPWEGFDQSYPWSVLGDGQDIWYEPYATISSNGGDLFRIELFMRTTLTSSTSQQNSVLWWDVPSSCEGYQASRISYSSGKRVYKWYFEWREPGHTKPTIGWYPFFIWAEPLNSAGRKLFCQFEVYIDPDWENWTESGGNQWLQVRVKDGEPFYPRMFETLSRVPKVSWGPINPPF